MNRSYFKVLYFLVFYSCDGYMIYSWYSLVVERDLLSSIHKLGVVIITLYKY